VVDQNGSEDSYRYVQRRVRVSVRWGRLHRRMVGDTVAQLEEGARAVLGHRLLC